MGFRNQSIRLVSIVISCTLFGCSQNAPPPVTDKTVKDEASSAPVSSPADPATADAGAQPKDTPGTPIEGPVGSIEGSVKFVGDEIPQPTMVANGTDPQICGSEISKRDVEISPDNKGIRYVLIWIEGVKLPEDYKPPTTTLILDNVKCQFEPHAAVITTGSTIETRNSDDVYHTTNLLGKAIKENIPLVTKGATYSTTVRVPELIGVRCDKHGWMQAFIRVDSHPFHAVTDAGGSFSIAGIPTGTYKLRFWHERFYGQDVEVTVTENETRRVDVTYPTAE